MSDAKAAQWIKLALAIDPATETRIAREWEIQREANEADEKRKGVRKHHRRAITRLMVIRDLLMEALDARALSRGERVAKPIPIGALAKVQEAPRAIANAYAVVDRSRATIAVARARHESSTRADQERATSVARVEQARATSSARMVATSTARAIAEQARATSVARAEQARATSSARMVASSASAKIRSENEIHARPRTRLVRMGVRRSK